MQNTQQPPAPVPTLTPAPDELSSLRRLGELIASRHSPTPDLIEAARTLTQAAGGARMPAGQFCAALLDLVDRVGHVPPATWLALCRGMALGASVPGRGSLPLPLRHAATRLLASLALPLGRRRAMAQALMLDLG